MLPTYTYLYGFTKREATQVLSKPYRQALKIKLQAAKDLDNRLHAPAYSEQDTARIANVQNAIHLNEELLEELV